MGCVIQLLADCRPFLACNLEFILVALASAYLLILLVALASAYLLQDAGYPSRHLAVEPTSPCEVYNKVQHGLAEYQYINLGCALLVHPLGSVGATGTAGGSSARATTGTASTGTTCAR